MDSNNNFRQLANELVSKLTLEEKLMLLSTHQHEVSRLDIGEFYIGQEVARGYVGRDEERYSTVFPQPVGLASTFDTELMGRLGEIAGNECRAYYNEDKKGGICVWGPTVDMERNPLWGRTEEAYGEDVFLAGEMTAAYTKTMAGDNGKYLKTIPTLKHFCANNNEEKRMSCDVSVPLRLKYEYYYAAFRNAIEYGGAKSVMTAYNSVNGVPAMCNPELKSILKEKWGLWFVVTDGEDFSQTVTAHHYCEKHSQTFAEGIKAGCDIMTDNDILVRNAAENALNDGLITENDIDNVLENVLYARYRLGQFTDDCEYDSITKDIVDTPESRKVNLRAANEQMILLKNNGILPIKNNPKKIAVLGALADENLRDWYTGVFRDAVSIRDGIAAEFPESEIVFDSLWDIIAIKAPNGKYLSVKEDGTVKADVDEITDSELFELQKWGEDWNNLFSVKYKKYLTFADDTLKLHNRTVYDWFTRETFNIRRAGNGFIFEEYLGHKRMICGSEGNILFKENAPVSDNNAFGLYFQGSCYQRAEEIASECDCVIYCTGNYPVQVAKECHDRKTLALNVQIGMAAHLHNVNQNTIMVLVSSYPYVILNENRYLPAILWTSHAGAALGTAAAQTISGKNNPAGRLPMTWYRSELDLPDIMNYDIEKTGATYMYFKGTPLYPFGYGLSYSEFEYSNLKLERTENGVSAVLDVKNISDTDGDEVIQIYFTVPDSAVSRPIKKLCGFSRAHIKSGETKTISINIPEHILQIYNTRNGRMITETGLYSFFAGSSSADIRLNGKLEINGEALGMRGKFFEAQSFDEGYNIRISYSRSVSEHYIRAFGGNGKAVYRGVDLRNKKQIHFTANSIHREETITFVIGDRTVEIKVKASDKFSSFNDYIADLPENLHDTDELAVMLPDSAAIMHITVI